MATHTRFIFLMHPKEYKQEKAATGRLTHLCLSNSEIIMGVSFEQDERVAALLADPGNYNVLLYPGAGAKNLTAGALTASELQGRRLVVFLLDATWSCARKMLKLSPVLQHLPRVVFSAQTSSRYIIKQQPQEGCLSTLEAVHEVLGALASHGLDRYEQPTQLLSLFQRMQDFQMRCAEDPTRAGYRRTPARPVAERVTNTTRQTGYRRNRFIVS